MPLRACRNSWPGYAVRSPGIRKAGTSRKNPLKRIWPEGTGRVQKDLPAKVREKRTGIRSGPAALTGIRGNQKGRASPPACAAFWRRRAWRPGHGPAACAEGAVLIIFSGRFRKTGHGRVPGLSIRRAGRRRGGIPPGACPATAVRDPVSFAGQSG